MKNGQGSTFRLLFHLLLLSLAPTHWWTNPDITEQDGRRWKALRAQGGMGGLHSSVDFNLFAVFHGEHFLW
jgi:hypothetical protein